MNNCQLTNKEKQLHLNLLENAFDYLNESLEYVVKAKISGQQISWKFAILNITFCIELLLKERLRREHPLLLYADLDKFKPITRETKTVSFSTSIERLRYILGDNLKTIDAGRLNIAQTLRNQMIHYDIILEFPAVYHDFANLINLVGELFNKEIRSSSDETLHDHIKINLWKEEESLTQAFVEEIVYYNGIFMPKDLQEEIENEQNNTTLVIDGTIYERIRYGDIKETRGLVISDYASINCHDCSVVSGQIHLRGCDMETCPKCNGQIISCKCNKPSLFFNN